MTADGSDYLVFGSTPWETPWIMSQNLAHALADRHRVMYADPPLSPLTPVRYGIDRRTLPRARALLRRRQSTPHGVELVRPVALPPVENERARGWSAPLVARQIRSACASAGIERPVLVALRADPLLLQAVDASLRVFFVDDWFEAGASLFGLDVGLIQRRVRECCEQADLILCISEQLQATLADRGFRSSVLQHAFHADLAPRYDDPVAAPELEGLGHPRLGYAGRIDARLDFESLGRLADRFPDGSVVLVGPVMPRLERSGLDALLARPNVHLVEPKSRDDLPGYLVRFDCLLMPYHAGDWAVHGSPTKLWDYLYAGAPVVGTGYIALKEFPPPLVRFETESERLVELVESALAAPAGESDARRSYAMANTWQVRAAEFERLVRGALPAC